MQDFPRPTQNRRFRTSLVTIGRFALSHRGRQVVGCGRRSTEPQAPAGFVVGEISRTITLAPPVVRKNEQGGRSHAGRGGRGWDQLGEHRGGGADHDDTSQPCQMLVVERDQGTSRLLGNCRIHRIGPTQPVLGRQRSGLVTECHIECHHGYIGESSHWSVR